MRVCLCVRVFVCEKRGDKEEEEGPFGDVEEEAATNDLYD